VQAGNHPEHRQAPKRFTGATRTPSCGEVVAVSIL
jgi:hypothetical protein